METIIQNKTQAQMPMEGHLGHVIYIYIYIERPIITQDWS